MNQSLPILLRMFFATSLVLLLITNCKNETTSPSQTAPLQVAFIHLDTLAFPKGDRPYIAGEVLHATVEIHGGSPPFEIQLMTIKGDPKFTNTSWQFERTLGIAQSGGKTQTNSEVASGRYQLAVRVSDHSGQAKLAHSEVFEVIGKPAHSSEIAPYSGVSVIDIAGRTRPAFHQGEVLRIRIPPKNNTESTFSIIRADGTILTSGAFAPQSASALLPLPRLLRPGIYRIQFEEAAANVVGEFRILGRQFEARSSPAIETIALYGGPANLLKTTHLSPGQPLRIEARMAGLKGPAELFLRIKTATGNPVYSQSLPPVSPKEVTPTARTIYSTAWTPGGSIPRGKYSLELTVDELGTRSTLSIDVDVQ